MAKPLVTDELWKRIQPHLPPEPPKPRGGRPRVADRACLTGILFILKTGTPWEYLPQEMGCGSGMTCWRRVRDWQAAGVWRTIWRELLNELGLADAIDWSTSAMDSCSVRALFGGESDRSREKREQTASDRGCQRGSAGDRAYRRQRSRLADGDGLGGWNPADQATAWSTSQTSGRSARRPGVRCGGEDSQAASAAWYQAVARQAQYRTCQRPGTVPLCGGSRVRLAV